MGEEELRAELASRTKALQRRAAGLASAGAAADDFTSVGEQRLFEDLQTTQARAAAGRGGAARPRAHGRRLLGAAACRPWSAMPAAVLLLVSSSR